MKKIFLLILAFLLVWSNSLPVFAANLKSYEAELLNELKKPIVLNGKTFYLDQIYINQAENYMASNTLTEDEAYEVIAFVSATNDILSSSGVTDLNPANWPQSVVNNITDKIYGAANAIGLKVQADFANNTLVILDQNGNTLFNYEGGSLAEASSSVIKNTGLNIDYKNLLIVSSSLLIVLAVSIFTLKKLHLFEMRS